MSVADNTDRHMWVPEAVAEGSGSCRRSGGLRGVRAPVGSPAQRFPALHAHYPRRPLPFGGAFVVSQGFATVLRCATFAHRRPPRPMVQDPRSACPAEDPRQKVRAWSWVVHERGSSQAVIDWTTPSELGSSQERTRRAIASVASLIFASASGPPATAASTTQWLMWSSSSPIATACRALVIAET